jgi:ribosomal protein L17
MHVLEVKNLIHTLYHYEIIKALSKKEEESEEFVDALVAAAKKTHSERIVSLYAATDIAPFAKHLQDELLRTVEDIPDATDVEKNAVREYVDGTPL